MTIDFDKIPENAELRFKGGDGVTHSSRFDDGRCKIMRGWLAPASSIGYHSHDTSSEIIFILSGKARCLYDDGEELLSPGQCHYCPKGHSHSMANASPDRVLRYLAVVPEQ